MTIERKTLTLKVHKNLVVQFLELHPEDLKQVVPTWEGTAKELITKLREHPAQWIIDGELFVEEQD